MSVSETKNQMMSSSVIRTSQTNSGNNHASLKSGLGDQMQNNTVGTQDKNKPMVIQNSSNSVICDFAHLRPRGGLRGKSYWRNVIDEVEFAVHCMSQPRLPVIDYSLVLPPRLRERVKQIQAYDYSKSDDVVFIRDEMREERQHDYQVASEQQDSREEEKDGDAHVSSQIWLHISTEHNQPSTM